MKKHLQILLTTIIVLLLLNSTGFAAVTKSAAGEKELSFPIKYICDSIGADINWDGGAKIVTVKYNNNILQFKIGSEEIISNGRTKQLKEKINTAAGRTLVPLTIINSELGINLTNDDCLKIVGSRFMQLLKNNTSAEASALLSETFSKYLSTENLSEISDFLSEVEFDLENATLSKNAVHQNLNIPFEIQKTYYNYIIRFDYDGKIDDLGTVLKSKSEYSYFEKGTSGDYTEQEVVIGEGVWKVPGTLTIPDGEGPFPVVILIQGLGPKDRDETTGAQKPFRDLANGLASRKIAVLRYDKRSLEHSTKMNVVGNITMQEETEQDVFAAAEYLKTVDKIDSSRIIMLGHDLGGYALPEIMKTGKDTFKAGIVMGGGTRPAYELYSEQFEYLVSKGLAGQKQLDYIKSQVEILKDPDFRPQNPPEEYTFGNEYYYQYMKDYDFTGLVKAIDKPMLVLQGERDYQVSAKTDFENWKEALNGNSQAGFKLYPKLNHLFTEGEGDSTPAEYNSASNIPEYVIEDIADFVYRFLPE